MAIDAPRSTTVDGLLRDLLDRMRKLERRVSELSGETTDDSLPFEAVGDLIVGAGYGVSTRLPVTDDGRFLEADSTELLGVKWGRRISVGADEPDSPAEGDVWLQTT